MDNTKHKKPPTDEDFAIAKDILLVGSFIGWHDDDYMQAGFTSKEAFHAFARLVRIDAVELSKIILGES